MIRAAGIGLLGIALLSMAGCADAPRALSRPAPLRATPPGTHPPDVELFVVKRGWHIDVGVAAPTLTPRLQAAQAPLPRAQYLLFGFGDRRYLTARSRRFDALLAALRPGAALILLTGLRETPQDAFGAHAVRTLDLPRQQMQALQEFIWQTLAHAHGEVVVVRNGPYAGSTYLAALPRYSGAHTCNTWAAQALRAAGLPVRTRGVVFAWQLWIQLRRLQRAAQPNGPTLSAALSPGP